MMANSIHESGRTDVLRLDEVADPALADGTVLIKTEAAGVNYADTMLQNGMYPTHSSLDKSGREVK